MTQKKMIIPQRKFREIVVQLLYSRDLNGDCDPQCDWDLFASLSIPSAALQAIEERVAGISSLLETIDRVIAKTARDYDIKRISRVECAVLRLGIYELLYDTSIPAKVAIAEAIRLNRKFGTKEGGAFVNAILDTVYQNESKSLDRELEVKKSAS